MPRGAAVIRYSGKRGVTWRIKWISGDGVQVQETLGREADGWTERKAKAALRARLVDVERDGYCRPDPITFGEFAQRFLDEYLPGRGLKLSTEIDYESTVHRHLVPVLGAVKLVELERRPELIDRYVTTKMAQRLSPKTVRNQVLTLGVMLKVAQRWHLISTNPCALVERPRVETREMQVLTEEEVAALLASYSKLEHEHEMENSGVWWSLTRRIVVVALGTAMRRGELLALRWGDVKLLEGLVRVERQWVRNEMTTPKSRTSRRTIELGPRVRAALEEQWEATVYRADADIVFGHPELGTPLDPSKLAREFMRPALKKAGIDKPFRPWHDLRHTALTHEAAAGNPQVYVQMKAGHSQGTITERYIHAAQVLFPGAAERGEERLFGAAAA
jgi:integrase